jgi:pyruvate kinase
MAITRNPKKAPAAEPRTKIVATIGPASAAPETIAALLEAGVNVARINLAHGRHEEVRELIARLRRAAAERNAPLAILADLAGPKLRIGRFRGGGVELLAGREFVLTTDEIEGDAEKVSVNHAGLPDDVRPGEAVFLNDGLIRLVVTRVSGRDVHTEVEVGGPLTDLKGLSVPGSEIGMPSLTEKDWRDVDFLAGQDVDYLGLSFVRSEADVESLREGLVARGVEIAIVAKIEKSQAVARLDSVIAAADAVMVARGDLGVECPIEDVPVLQKRIIAACRAAAKPVITATQMLESMVESPRPTRAEASDVANAVLDGTDAVMLSGETAMGRYPVETVRMMRRIIVQTEAFAPELSPQSSVLSPRSAASIADAVGAAACLAADSLQAAAIVSLTQSGATARYLSRWHPRQPILGVTPHARTWRALALLRGVEPFLANVFDVDFDEACARVMKFLRAEQRFSKGARVVLTAGLPFSNRGRTNTIRIDTI